VGVLLVILAFISGSVPFGYLIVRLFYGRDIRQLGSGNIGMTNVWRNFGWKPGIATLVLDFGKGYLPVIIAGSIVLKDSALQPGFWQVQDYFASPHFLLTVVALAAVLGHSFTPLLRFRGGKGFATALGAFSALVGYWILVPIAVFIIFFALFRFISLGSMTASLAFFIVTLAVPSLRAYVPLGALIAVFILYTHRHNIARLMAGKEPKFSL